MNESGYKAPRGIAYRCRTIDSGCPAPEFGREAEMTRKDLEYWIDHIAQYPDNRFSFERGILRIRNRNYSTDVWFSCPLQAGIAWRMVLERRACYEQKKS